MFYRYYAYDVFGHYKTSFESEADALQQVYNSTELQDKIQARYINQQEIDSWDQQLTSFDCIVEDGTYQVYRIINETKKQQGLDPYLYFDSYSAALNAIKADINKEFEISKTKVNVYLYIYTDQNHIDHNITYTNDEQLHDIVKYLAKNSK